MNELRLKEKRSEVVTLLELSFLTRLGIFPASHSETQQFAHVSFFLRHSILTSLTQYTT